MGNSRVGPIQEHLFVAGSAVRNLVDFFELAIAGDWPGARETQKRINRLEGKARKLKHELALYIPRHLMLSEVCAEMVDLLALQSDVVARTRSIVAVVVSSRLEFPLAIQERMISLVESTVSVNELNLLIIENCDQASQNAEPIVSATVDQLIDRLARLEADTDRLSISIRNHLFRLEKSLVPIEIILLHRIVDQVSELADRSQTVGLRLQLMLSH